MTRPNNEAAPLSREHGVGSGATHPVLSGGGPPWSRLLARAGLWAGLFLLPGLSAACAEVESPAPDEEALFGEGEEKAGPRSIQDLIGGASSFRDFEALLVSSGLASEMTSPPHTVFIPWNVAFDKLPPYWDQAKAKPAAWKAHLRELAKAHLHSGRVPDTQSKDVALRMWDETVADFRVKPRRTLDGIAVIASTAASNGHAYAIDGVRLPAWARRTALDIVNADPRFSVLKSLLTEQDRARLAAVEGLTLFAPTNAAFGAAPFAKLPKGVNINVRDYVVDGLMPYAYTPSGVRVALSGSSIRWDVVGGRRSIQCTRANRESFASVGVAADQELANNGIVHPIENLACSTVCTDCTSEFFKQALYGTHEVVVFNLRCVSGNCREPKTQTMWENLSRIDVENAFFGDQRYSASSWYSDCSDEQFRFAPSSYGGVIDVDVDGSELIEGHRVAEQRFKERFGLNPWDAVEHVVYCYPKHRRGPNVASARINDGVLEGSAVNLSHGHCVDAGVILHELGHASGLKHAAGFQANGSIGAYSDNTDIMGGALTGPQCFNGTNLWRTGWYRDKSISLSPAKGSSLDVSIASILDRDKAGDHEHLVVKLGDYHLRYNVREPNELPGARQSFPELEMDRRVTITKETTPAGATTHGSLLYAGIDVGSTYSIENFRGTDTLYVKGCSRSEGDASHARSMTVSIGYDQSQLCDMQCPDSDGDQTSDCEDRCPYNASKTEYGVCGCGSSDADTDRDGRLDCMDRCPNDPRKTHPLQCGCGVPEGSCGQCVDGSPSWCQGSVVENGLCFEGSSTDHVRSRCCKTCFIDLKNQW